jgi:Zn finger protein HypA/HybF involved in hydrogenase expression
MIEVIKPGVLYEDRLFEIACRMCKAQLRFLGSDVTEGTTLSWVVCPQCDNNTDIKTAKDVTVEPAPA